MIRYRCRNCGNVLLEFDPDKLRLGLNEGLRYHGVPEPQYVISIHRGVCPYCGRKLSNKPTVEVSIRGADSG